MTRRTRQELPKELLDGLYKPEFLPDELRLNEFVVYQDEEDQKTESKVVKKIVDTMEARPKLNPAVPIPLTEAEAKAAKKFIDSTRDRLRTTRTRISKLRLAIDDAVGSAGQNKPGGEISFDVSIKRKPFLKRAVKKVFGEKRNTITYSMYKEALAIKREIEEGQTQGYLDGSFEGDD